MKLKFNSNYAVLFSVVLIFSCSFNFYVCVKVKTNLESNNAITNKLKMYDTYRLRNFSHKTDIQIKLRQDGPYEMGPSELENNDYGANMFQNNGMSNNYLQANANNGFTNINADANSNQYSNNEIGNTGILAEENNSDQSFLGGVQGGALDGSNSFQSYSGAGSLNNIGNSGSNTNFASRGNANSYDSPFGGSSFMSNNKLKSRIFTGNNNKILTKIKSPGPYEETLDNIPGMNNFKLAAPIQTISNSLFKSNINGINNIMNTSNTIASIQQNNFLNSNNSNISKLPNANSSTIHVDEDQSVKNHGSVTFKSVGPNVDSTVNSSGQKYSEVYNIDNSSKDLKIGFYGKSRLTR